jgi:archaellum component FlaC
VSGDNKRQPGPILGQIPRLPRPARLPAADGDAIEARDAEIERLRAEVERLTDELQQVANEIALAESQEARRG